MHVQLLLCLVLCSSVWFPVHHREIYRDITGGNSLCLATGKKSLCYPVPNWIRDVSLRNVG